LNFPRHSAKAPVTQVSWFAANAYCEAQGKSLPTTDQWELALFDRGRNQEKLKQTILAWYGRPNSEKLDDVGKAGTNGYGISDLGILVWEWTEDFNAFLAALDSREGGADDNLFCGNGSRMGDASDYAAFMRYSFRSSLKANYTTSNLGFRCAKEGL
jgi:formylglycine-generating enzyme required for sulfatase activity